MAENIRQLEEQIRAKEQELKDAERKLTGASIGENLTDNSFAGLAADVYKSKKKDAQKQIEREINDLKQKIKDTEREVSRLKSEQDKLRDGLKMDEVRAEADVRHQRQDLERQRLNEQDPAMQQQFVEQIHSIERELEGKERDREREVEKEIAKLQAEIESLTL